MPSHLVVFPHLGSAEAPFEGTGPRQAVGGALCAAPGPRGRPRSANFVGGTGPGGRILHQDVDRFIARGRKRPAFEIT